MNRPDPHPFHSLKAHAISHEEEFTPSHPPKMPSSLLEVKEAKHRGYLSAYQPFDEMLLRCKDRIELKTKHFILRSFFSNFQ